MQFRIQRDPAGSGLLIALVGDDGSVLLTASGCPAREPAMGAIRAALEHLADPERFKVAEEAGKFILILEGEGGGPRWRGPPLASAAAARTRRDDIVAAAAAQQRYEVVFAEHQTGPALTGPPVRWEMLGNVELLYDFAFCSTSGRPGFECFFRQDKGQYYFHLNGESGEAILYSRGFALASRRDQRLRAVVENAALLQRLEPRNAGGYYFIVKARNGQEIARSRTFGQEVERAAALRWVHEHVTFYGAGFLRKHQDRVAGRDQYRLDLCPIAGKAGFEALRDKGDRRYYFLFNDDEGVVLLFSQGYRSRESRDHGIRALIRSGLLMDGYELCEEAGRFYFVIWAKNHQQLGRSRWFDSREAAAAAMHLIRLRLPHWAAAFSVELTPQTERKTDSLILTVARDRREPEPAVAPLPVLVPEPAQEAAPPVPVPEPAQEAAPSPAASDALSQAPPPPGTVPPARSAPPWAAPLLLILLCVAMVSVLLYESWHRSPLTTVRSENTADSGQDMGTPRLDEAAPAAEPDASQAAAAPVTGTADLGGLPLRPGSMEAAMVAFLSQPDVRLPHLFTMDRLLYPPNSHEMNAEGQEQVYILGRILLAFPSVSIEIRGHNDGTEFETYIGPKPYRDYTLSQLRADCVYRRLTNQGVSASRMRMQGRAHFAPVADDATMAGRQRNRRVEIVVLRR